MKTNNKKLLKKKENKDYYASSDGNFMPLDRALFAHKYLDRIAWVRDWVHELGSEVHMSIGCKDGYTDLTLASEGIECIGIDPSTDAIEEAKLKAQEAELTNVKFIVGFGEDIPEEIEVDTVDICEVIEHVVDPKKLLEVASRTGKYVMITTPDAHGKHGLKDADRNPEHVRLYTQKELEKLVSKYGVIRESLVRDDAIYIIYRSY